MTVLGKLNGHKPLAGKILAGIGVTVILSEVILRILAIALRRETYELDHWVLAIGALIGFTGFWMIDSKKTKEATEVLTDVIPKFGRRKTDVIAQPGTITTVIPQPPGDTGVVDKVRTEIEVHTSKEPDV